MQIHKTSDLSSLAPTKMLYNPNFKGINIVQIPRKAFKHPENYKECSKLFGKILDRASREKLRGKLGSIIAVFVPKASKTVSVLETPSYAHAKTAMRKTGNNYSIAWLRQNTGLPVKDSMDNNYHSFYVLTKEHKAGYMDIFKQGLKNLMHFATEGVLKYPENKKMSSLYAQTKFGVEADKAFDKLVAETQVKEFKLQNLDEIKNIVKDLDI